MYPKTAGGMTGGKLLMMSYQVTGEAGHEWTGIAMTAIAKLAPTR